MRSLGKICLSALLCAAACGDEAPRFTDAALGVDAGLDAAVDGGSDAAVAAGRPGHGTVAGAVKARSAGYKLYGTVRSGDGSSASPGYQRRGGIAGATQP